MGGHPWAGRGGAQGAQATALPTRRHARPWAVMALLVLAAWVVAGGVVVASRRHRPTALSDQIDRLSDSAAPCLARCAAMGKFGAPVAMENNETGHHHHQQQQHQPDSYLLDAYDTLDSSLVVYGHPEHADPWHHQWHLWQAPATPITGTPHALRRLDVDGEIAAAVDTDGL